VDLLRGWDNNSVIATEAISRFEGVEFKEACSRVWMPLGSNYHFLGLLFKGTSKFLEVFVQGVVDRVSGLSVLNHHQDPPRLGLCGQ